MMKLELLNATVVVLAEEHNPTILHPAFLTAEGIVPEDWELADKPLCTPAFSLAKYANGISFTVEGNRFIVTEELPAGNPSESMIANLAVAYVEKLPHVRYKAIGINFNGCCLRKDDPEQFLIERFLKVGPWNDQSRPMKAFGSRFLYDLQGTAFRFGIDGGQLNREGKTEAAVLVSGNFHTDLTDDKPLGALRASAAMWAERLGHFISMSNMILGMEEEK